MYGVVSNKGGPIVLQATLAASSASGVFMQPHHPISCTSELQLYEDGTFECEHVRVKDDSRTRSCIDHSIAILLIEMAIERFG